MSSRFLLVRLAAVALAAATILTTPASPAPAAQAPIVSAHDQRGDVRILRHRGPSVEDRRSIDIRSARVVDRGHRVRFEVTLRRIVMTQQFDQMVFIALSPARSSDAEWTAQAGLSPQMARYGYAYWFADATGEDFESCDPIRSRARPARATVWIDIPKRCLPTGPTRIKIDSLTGTYRGDSPPYSRDRLIVPGLHSVR